MGRAVCVLLLLGLATIGQAESAGSDDPLYQPVINESTLNYLLHLPAGYEETDTDFPLLFFLHGIAQKGSGSQESLEKVAVDGPFRAMREGLWDQRLPLIVVGPQSSGLQPWWRGEEVRKVLKHVRKTYRIDEKRVYLSGISMGGRSVWWLAKNFSNEFAAMVPVSGWAGDVTHSCETFRHLPIWAFHGENDPLIGLNAGRKPVEVLNTCEPAHPVPSKITILDAGHGDWDRIYSNKHHDANTGAGGELYSDIYRWMLSFRRR